MTKTLANPQTIVYAFKRYPISVTRTMLVQGRNPTLVGEQMTGDIYSGYGPGGEYQQII